MGSKLTVLGVKTLVKPGRYSDGDGLHLHVRGADRRAWVLRWTRNGKTRDMGLGTYPTVSLAEARQAARDAQQIIRQGGDPVAARRAASNPEIQARHTFRAVAEGHIAAHRESWRNPKHAAQWVSTLERHAYPLIGSMAVDQVGVEDVLRVLKPLWTKTPETAGRLRGRLEVVLDAARARGWRTGDNPARWKGNLAGLLPPISRLGRIEHQPSLPWQQIGAFMGELRKQSGVGPRALEFAILTAARTGEVRGATWAEFDLEQAIWSVPAARMKAGKLHRVPLSEPVLQLLRGMVPTRAGLSSLVFAGRKRDAPISDMTLSALVRRMNAAPEGAEAPWRDISGRAIVPHGFRSTFRVWAGEQTTYPREVVEAALAHAIKDKVEAAYARTDLLERRRPLMVEWTKWCG